MASRASPVVVLLDALPDEQDLYGTAFDDAGFTTRIVANVDDAMAVISATHVDAVVARIVHPSRAASATELIRQVKERDEAVRVVVLTTEGESEFRHATLTAGGDACLLLPVRPDVVLQQVEGLLH